MVALQRVVQNLATNAVKYGSAETPITITLKEFEHDAQIAVHNEGNGLTQEEQAHVFDKFHRTKSAVASGRNGWGIGLTLVKGIAEAHGGSVIVESELGKGVTFIVKLPREVKTSALDRSA